MNATWLQYLDRRWADVAFYQSMVRRLVHDENRRDALGRLTRAVIISDRAERAQ